MSFRIDPSFQQELAIKAFRLLIEITIDHQSLERFPPGNLASQEGLIDGLFFDLASPYLGCMKQWSNLAALGVVKWNCQVIRNGGSSELLEEGEYLLLTIDKCQEVWKQLRPPLLSILEQRRFIREEVLGSLTDRNFRNLDRNYQQCVADLKSANPVLMAVRAEARNQMRNLLLEILREE